MTIFLLIILSLFLFIREIDAWANEEKELAEAQISVTYHEIMAANLPSAPRFLKDEIRRVSIDEVDSDGEIFLEKGQRVVICIKKENFDADQVTIRLIEESYEDGSKRVLSDGDDDSLRWFSGEDCRHYTSMDFSQEGHFRMMISYGFYEKEAIYYSPLITIDDMEPEVEKFSALTKEAGHWKGISIYKESASYELILKEENFNEGFFSWKGIPKGYESLIKMSPWETYYEDGCRKNRTILTIEIPGVNHLLWECRDGVGRHKVGGELNISIDDSSPLLSVSSERDPLCKDWGYKEIRYFSRKPVTFQLAAQDKESGIKAIEYSVWSRGKKIKEFYLENPEQTEEFSLTISLKEKDFCGWISAKAINGVDKESQLQNSEVYLWESGTTANSLSKTSFLLPKADFYDSRKNISYYKDDVTIKLSFRQSYAGVRECGIMAEEDGRWNFLKDSVFSEDFETEQNRTLLLSAKDYDNPSSNRPIHIRGTYIDNAGYSWNSEEHYILIDKSPPIVHAEYHTEKEEAYRNEIQYATVTVEDVNFDASSVIWKIQGDPSGYQIGQWQGKGKKHYCKVTFLKDGIYRLGLQVSDFAKNMTNWMEENTFTLDTTLPKIRLWMDESDVSCGKYYKHAKRLYLFIKEENFDQKGIEIRNRGKLLNLTLEKEEGVLKEMPGLFKKRGWRVYSVLIDEDAFYAISCQCEDMAGNLADKQKYPPFVIDQSGPLVKNINISDGMTYTGEISAKILIEDKNLADGECRLTPYFENGKRADFLERYVERSRTKEGAVCFALRDLPREKSMDNIYVLKIEGRDLAGNDIKYNKKFTFYVDRYGARYEISQATEDYLEKYYVREAEDLTVRVFSLHTVETDILVTKDNELFRSLSLKKKEYDIDQVKLDGNEQKKEILPFHSQGWYQTSYHISKKVFDEEGTYRILLRSRERRPEMPGEILTESENGIWTRSIEFNVDKTPPTVVIGGLNEKEYDDTNHQFTITAMDNTKLKKVRVHFGKEKEEYVEIYKDYLGEYFNENHSITTEIMEWEGGQSIWYEAWDHAGNYITLSKDHPARKFMIAKNPITRAYYVHPVKMAAAFLVVFILLLMVYILTRRQFFAILKRTDRDYYEE